MPPLAIIVDAKKFMWDKGVYADESEAKEKMVQYEKDGFEVTLVSQEDQYFVYSRRVVSEIVLD